MKIDEMLHKVMSSLLPTSISVIVSSSDLMDSQILNFKYAFNQIFEENLKCYLLCLLLQVKLNDNWKFSTTIQNKYSQGLCFLLISCAQSTSFIELRFLFCKVLFGA